MFERREEVGKASKVIRVKDERERHRKCHWRPDRGLDFILIAAEMHGRVLIREEHS